MLKKIYVLLTLLFLLFILTVQSHAAQRFGAGFPDVPGTHWAAEQINLAVNKKWVFGYDDGTFRPDQLVTRSELATIMARAAGVPPLNPGEPSFLDVGPDQWYFTSVETVKDYFAADPSLINGLFRPNDPVTRQEAAAAMALASGGGAKGADPDVLKGLFADYESINPAYRIYISQAVKSELIKGYPDGYFRPDNPLTRAEALSLIFKVFHNDITIYRLLTSGAVTGINRSSEEFLATTDFLNSRMGNLDGVNLQYYIKAISSGGNTEDKLLLVFGRVDPFKYFSFSEAVFSSNPEKIRELVAKVAVEVSRNYPAQRIIAVIGYTNLTFYSTTPETYGEEYTDYMPEEGGWKVDRFYAAVISRDGAILDTWLEPRR
ncbi:MAG: S-layer homology domain-containing protein [Bacillota bacterium]